MKTTSVTAHYERKLNTGDYSSVTLATWATVEVEEGETAEDVLAVAMTICRNAVKDAATPFVKNGAVPVTTGEQFAGRQVKNGFPAGLDDSEAAGIASELLHDYGAR